MSTELASRSVRRVVKGMPTSDGAGVKLRRVIGQPQLPDLDPFLMLDEFGTDRAEDYIAGFPDHPHRGFETVTYMLDGRMRHKDNHGNEGVLVPGSVQWMTAGRGLVHSEMPEQQAGRMRGFQLWLNLPAREKMTAPKYQEFGPERIPTAAPAPGVSVKVIAGETRQRRRPGVPARGTSPGMRPPRRAGCRARPGGRAGPSTRAARPGSRTPPRPPRHACPRTGRVIPHRRALRPVPARKSVQKYLEVGLDSATAIGRFSALSSDPDT